VAQVACKLELPFWRYGAKCAAYAGWGRNYSMGKMLHLTYDPMPHPRTLFMPF